ncbi:hypothetical protein [[Clostridium] polysaccharolyticum]|jgi:hypothetical protein|uniref:Uncharacterized protein n=1 Tax=[Clostridium] polysaccharolyticum TaxID=29364 RepID=A0A1H9YNM6_9FIRM|nr:hypothetical protein [[Clostridium] polysaccharolyticum]SES70739.1 hypothetical protein SAMN04487772_102126 [[Clostridium] polysaccharolyticum]
MADLDWIHDPLLKNMSHHKKEILTSLIKQAEGKSAAETIPILLSTQKLMNEQGVKFSPQEQNAMFSILSKKLNPQEQQRFDAMKKMMRF